MWKFSACVVGYGIHQKPKLCSFVHPLRKRHKERCNGVLLKTVELATQRKIFYPLMTYCYIDLHTFLQQLLLNANFVENCMHWKSRSTTDDTLGDVNDGQTWKKFLNYDGTPFLSDDSGFAFMLNLDWFQPYKHLTYSVGAIYLSVFNLPRKYRYKLENICLVGIIPGPSEPELTINSYLDPLVQDLQKFWGGIELDVNRFGHVHSEVVRCAVICCSCDLPAGRKTMWISGTQCPLGLLKVQKIFSFSKRPY